MTIKKINFLPDILLKKGIDILLNILLIIIVIFLFDFFTHKEKEIATINITEISGNFVKELQSKNIKGDELKDKVLTFGIRLEKEIKNLSKQNELILVPKEAVIAGVEDYTAYIEAKLKKE